MTETPIREKYYRLADHLGLDLLDMEGGFMRTPRVLQDAGELAAKADEASNLARHALDIAVATVADRLRQVPVNGKEPSQARIESMVPLDPDVQHARNAHAAAIYDAKICSALFESFKQQAFLLTKAADMVVAGYITPAALNNQLRGEIRRARVAAEEQEKRYARPGS